MSRWHFIFECFPSESPSLRCFSLSSTSAPPGSSGTRTGDPCTEQPGAAPPFPSYCSACQPKRPFICRYHTAFLPFFPTPYARTSQICCVEGWVVANGAGARCWLLSLCPALTCTRGGLEAPWLCLAVPCREQMLHPRGKL